MKSIKSLVLFVISVVGVSACFNPPEFPISPKIEFQNIYFIDVQDPAAMDSLVVEINFQDGDGDLGLDPRTDNDIPYHARYFYLDTDRKLTRKRSLKKQNNQVKKAFSTDLIAGENEIQGMPSTTQVAFIENNPKANCDTYIYTDVYLRDSTTFIDQSYTYKKQTINGQVYVVATDTFYVETNRFHYNIFVTLYDNQDVALDEQFGETCEGLFFARFPLISARGNSPKEGTIRYAMQSFGLKPVLRDRPFYAKISIADRARNESNVITTPVVTLSTISRNR